MPDVTLTKTRLAQGVWHGVLSGSRQPELVLTCQDQPVEGLSVIERGDGGWDVTATIPAEAISDGVQTFVIAERATGERLASFAVLAGEALAEDIRAEIDLLRAELDMLKRAFRRHCLETL